jgi:hypothetical protein
MSAIRIGTGPSHAAVTPPGRTRGRSSWQRDRTCAGDRDPRWPRRRDHVPHRQPHARPARRWPGSWSSACWSPHRPSPSPGSQPSWTLARPAGWLAVAGLGNVAGLLLEYAGHCCIWERGVGGEQQSRGASRPEGCNKAQSDHSECRRPRLVVQPHLLFASLVVCASGASLVAATPSCPGQDEAGLDGCGPHQGDQQPADLGHRRVAEPLGPGRQQLLRA